jgi:nucleotide-binding universal stress UspA family protein
MPQLLDRRPSGPEGIVEHPRARPVLLATLAVRVEENAERMAFASALDAGASLILASMITMPAYPLTVVLAREYATLPHEEDLDAVRATADRAAALGIATQLLRVSSRRPVKALLELVRECDAGLLVFGPDRSHTPRWRFRSVARAVRRNAPCLVWITPDG